MKRAPNPRSMLERRRAAGVRAASFLFAVAMLCLTPSAQAFCRSTTCADDACPRDEHGCKTTGHPLAWATQCIGFSLQRDGTANLPLAGVRRAIENAFVAWSDLACDGGPATIAFSELADVACHSAEYNPGGANANIIL